MIGEGSVECSICASQPARASASREVRCRSVCGCGPVCARTFGAGAARGGGLRVGGGEDEGERALLWVAAWRLHRERRAPSWRMAAQSVAHRCVSDIAPR